MQQWPTGSGESLFLSIDVRAAQCVRAMNHSLIIYARSACWPAARAASARSDFRQACFIGGMRCYLTSSAVANSWRHANAPARTAAADATSSCAAQRCRAAGRLGRIACTQQRQQQVSIRGNSTNHTRTANTFTRTLRQIQTDRQTKNLKHDERYC